MTRRHLSSRPRASFTVSSQDTPTMATVAARFVSLGYVRRYTVLGRGRKRYHVAFAHPSKRIAVTVGRKNDARTEALRDLGWTVWEIDSVQGVIRRWSRLGRRPS